MGRHTSTQGSPLLWVGAEPAQAVSLVRDGLDMGVRVLVLQNTDKAREALATGDFLAEVYSESLSFNVVVSLVQWSLRASMDPIRVRALISSEDSSALRLRAMTGGLDLVYRFPLDNRWLLEDLLNVVELRRKRVVKVLLLESDRLLREHLLATLPVGGLRLLTVESPETLIRQLDEYHPDVILLDPDMTAYSPSLLSRALRSNPAWRVIPIVVLTALDDHEERIAAFGAGCDDFIMKPVSAAELRTRLRRHAARADARKGQLRFSSNKQQTT